MDPIAEMLKKHSENITTVESIRRFQYDKYLKELKKES